MLAVEILMLESLLNHRFRGRTMSYSELLVAYWRPSSSTRLQQSRQPETGTLTRVLRWKTESRRKMTVQTREKKETSESWTSNCRLYTKDPAKEHGVFLERVRAGLKKETKVAKVAKMQIREETTHGRRVVARKEAEDKIKVARVTAERVGLVLKQDALQRGAERTAKKKTCTPLMKMRVNKSKKHLTMMTSCKRGVCWKKARMSSGKRCSADEI